MTYDVVLADPPWAYTGQQDKWGAAAKFYPTMSNEDIFSFDMRSFMNDKSLLFMWITCPKLDIAVEALAKWGLYYRGVAFVWVKTKQDGTPVKAQGVRPSVVKPLTELVLVASTIKTGRPLKLYDETICQTIFAPKQEHSRKPDEVHERIERMYPFATKIELFARRRRLGWDVWGNEV